MGRFIFLMPILLSHLVSLQAWAQTPDTTFYDAAVNSTKSLYTMSQGEQARLFTGIQFVEYRYPFQNDHPFFKDSNPTTGTIHYDGVTYTRVPMWYDLIRDEVVVLNQVSQTKIVLQSKKVKEFWLAGHHFVRIDSVPGMPIGYYDRLYDGSTTLVAKRFKRPTEVIAEMRVKIDISSLSSRYYLEKDGRFRTLEKPVSVRKELAEKRREIDDYIKTNRLNFRRDAEESMIKVLA